MRLAENSLSQIAARCVQEGVKFYFRSDFLGSSGLGDVLQIDELKAAENGFEPL